jgi:hypothetical protein
MLTLVAQNDKLKITELADRKKIRFLLASTGGSEAETTYFKKALASKSMLIFN